jgi:BirA family transcriptional regulator, biotin operon repressor / biotin---[acetyl-CoA-carboxylase] ligase
MVNNLKILHSSRSKVLIFSRNPMPVQHIGHRIQVLETVDSSNNYAMALVRQKKAIHGEAIFALEQTAGKGQMGRRWITNKGENIILSIVLETALLPANALFSLSLAMSLAGYDFLQGMAGDGSCIKWPNDLYWRDRKAGGILIENSWKGAHWQFAIVGIGININQVVFGEGLKKPVSLKQITGKTTDLMTAVQQLCKCVEQRWQQLLRGEEKELLQTYNTLLYARDTIVQLRVNGREITTRILGVNGLGELLTTDSGGGKFKLGEVEWV